MSTGTRNLYRRRSFRTRHRRSHRLPLQRRRPRGSGSLSRRRLLPRREECLLQYLPQRRGISVRQILETRLSAAPTHPGARRDASSWRMPSATPSRSAFLRTPITKRPPVSSAESTLPTARETFVFGKNGRPALIQGSDDDRRDSTRIQRHPAGSPRRGWLSTLVSGGDDDGAFDDEESRNHLHRYRFSRPTAENHLPELEGIRRGIPG